MSNVGSSGVYEAGDQRNVPESEVQNKPKYEEGQEGSHKNLDSSTFSHDKIIRHFPKKVSAMWLPLES